MKEIFNLPNILSFFRLLLVPVFILAFFFSPDDTYAAALIIFLIASFTDLLDGIIAKSFNKITSLGIVLDPLADKLLTMSALICFGIAGIIPLWLVIVMVSVDLLMILSGLILFKRKFTIPSNFWGKLGTLTMSVGIVMCFFHSVVMPWDLCVLYAGLVIVLLSIIFYAVLNYKEALRVLKMKKNKTETKENINENKKSKNKKSNEIKSLNNNLKEENVKSVETKVEENKTVEN